MWRLACLSSMPPSVYQQIKVISYAKHEKLPFMDGSGCFLVGGMRQER